MTSEERKHFLEKKKIELYKKYCDNSNPNWEYNRDQIDYIILEVLSRQLSQENPAELEALDILTNRGIQNIKYQEVIPILSEGGKIEHLYIADIMIGNTLIEIDGSFHTGLLQQEKDILRENLLKSAGYKIKRYATYEVEKLKKEIF